MADSAKADLTIARAGEFFMYCLWIQGQMADLLILKKNSDLIPLFVADPKVRPKAMVEHRAKYWEKDFGPVKDEFIECFGSAMSPEQLDDLNVVYHLRNLIGHCHVSLGRDYLLYRPRNEKREREVVAALGLEPRQDQANPTLMTLRLSDDERYLYDFARLKRLDEECFKVIAASLGVPHGQIR